jgi:Ca2+-binding RTX toxin-like protein
MAIIISADGETVFVDGRVEGEPAYRITAPGVRLVNTERGRIISTKSDQPAISMEAGGGVIVNEVGGIIRGFQIYGGTPVIIGSAGADEVRNSGLIVGNVALFGGNDLFVQSTGQTSSELSVDLGAGNDRYELISRPGQSHSIYANGGEGFDTLMIQGTPGELNGYYSASAAINFERLEFVDAWGNMLGFSGFQQISIVSTILSGYSGTVNLIDSDNPLADVQMDGGRLSVAGASSVRNVTGSDRSETVELSSGYSGAARLLGSVQLGGGDDGFWFTNWDSTTPLPTIAGIVDGGAGTDVLNVSVNSSSTLDLGVFRNFEILNTGTFSSATSSVRVVNASGLLEITGDSDGRLTIAQSDLPNAVVNVSSRGTLILESTTTIGRYGFPNRDSFETVFDQVQQGNDLWSVTVINNGTILGAVQLYYGDDFYDGRLGTTGGTIFGYAGNDTLYGGRGNERIEGGFGADDLFGEGGNDWLNGGSGGDRLDGGDGFDYTSYANASSAVLADLVVWTLNIGEASGDTYANVEGILGSGFNDDLRGTGGVNWIYGGAGADIAYGRGGDDVLIGEAGDDTLWGNDGNDELYGGDGLDRLLGGAGADVLNGEGGFDFAHYDDASSGITVDLTFNPGNAGGAQGDRLFNVEGLVGSSFGDRLLGDGNTNWLYGVNGNDVIDGRGGDDVLIAGNGDDFVIGGDGNDLMFGEIGDDILIGGNGNDRMDGGAGNDTLTGGTGVDVLIGNLGFDYVAYEDASAGVTVDLVAWANNSGEAAGDSLIEVEGIIGSGFNDSLRGDAGANFLYGLNGADVIYGRGGDDVLIGGDGDDMLFGNQGDDAIYGGAGNDSIMFGAGDGRDALFDFAAGAGDVIQLGGSLGVSSFEQLQWRMTQVGGDTIISFDATTSLTIVGVTPGALAANDFIFG